MNIVDECSQKSILQEIQERFIEKPIVVFTHPLNAGVYHFFLKENSISPIAITTNDLSQQGEFYDGLKILSLEETIERYGLEINFFIICRDKYRTSIIEQLYNNGIPLNQCFTTEIISNPHFAKAFTVQQLELHCVKDEIQNIFNMLQDEQSRKVYRRILEYRYAGYNYQVDDIPLVEKEYFQQDIFTFSEKEVYVDAGVWNGETIREFIECVNGKYKKIYGIEANPINCRICTESFMGEQKVEIIGKGLYDSDSVVKINLKNNYNSSIDPSGDTEIETMRGDSLEDNPTFIKMDIEGGELKALQGFENKIKELKPKLAICIYHKIEDLWVIPSYIKELVPDYKMYIRHHSKFGNLYETVLYAAI